MCDGTCRWDVNKLHAQYWDEQKKVLKAAGIKKKKKKKKQAKDAMVECLVCCDDVCIVSANPRCCCVSFHLCLGFR